MMRLLVFFILFLQTSLTFGQTNFLLNPTGNELASIASLFQETGTPIPLHFAYDLETKEILTWGLANSTRIRNGAHARLSVSAGIVDNLQDAAEGKSYNKAIRDKMKHNLGAGTLFIEKVNSEVVLSVHGRNSFRSTMNINSRESYLNYTVVRNTERSILQQISDKTNTKIGNCSPELYNKINSINERIHPGDSTLITSDANRLYFDIAIEPGLSLEGASNSITPNERQAFIEKIKNKFICSSHLET